MSCNAFGSGSPRRVMSRVTLLDRAAGPVHLGHLAFLERVEDARTRQRREPDIDAVPQAQAVEGLGHDTGDAEIPDHVTDGPGRTHAEIAPGEEHVTRPDLVHPPGAVGRHDVAELLLAWEEDGEARYEQVGVDVVPELPHRAAEHVAHQRASFLSGASGTT